jgi:hypothetical protein
MPGAASSNPSKTLSHSTPSFNYGALHGHFAEIGTCPTGRFSLTGA